MLGRWTVSFNQAGQIFSSSNASKKSIPAECMLLWNTNTRSILAFIYFPHNIFPDVSPPSKANTLCSFKKRWLITSERAQRASEVFSICNIAAYCACYVRRQLCTVTRDVVCFVGAIICYYPNWTRNKHVCMYVCMYNGKISVWAARPGPARPGLKRFWEAHISATAWPIDLRSSLLGSPIPSTP